VLPPLSQLVAENPFRTLRWPITAKSTDLRDRVDELEMEFRLGDESAVDRAGLLRAQQLLMDPEARAAAEVLSDWEEDADLDTWAEAQSAAVLALITLFNRPTQVQEAELVSTVASWVDLAEDEALAESFVVRQAEFGSPNPIQLANLIGPWILAGLLRRVLESCPGAAARCLNETSGFSGEARLAIEDAVVPVIEATVTEPTEGPGPSANAASAAIANAGTALAQLDGNGIAHERLHDAILRFANSLAVDFYNAEDFASSEMVLATVVTTPLHLEAVTKFKKDLRTVRYTRGWREANRAIERKDWDGCLVGLRRALESAPTAEEASETERAISAVNAKRKTTGVGGFARRTWGAFGGLAIVIGVIAGIGFLAGSGDDDGLQKARDAYFDSTKARALNVRGFDEASESSRFVSAASTAERLALAMAAEARTSSSYTAACRRAIEQVGTSAARHWYYLGAGARMKTVRRWNEGIDEQAEMNRNISQMNSSC
jgi:hypothetical protein